MPQGDRVAIRYVQQGEVVANSACIERDGDTVKAIAIDLATKYAELCGTGGSDCPCVGLMATEHTLYCGESAELTLLELPGLNGWSVWAASVSRYTVYLCVVRDASRGSRTVPVLTTGDDPLQPGAEVLT